MNILQGTLLDVFIEDISEDGVLVVPERIRRIADRALDNNRFIQKVVLPEKLQVIGCEAFAGCMNLKTINIPENIKLIENRAFISCEALESITFPEGVIAIGENVCCWCVSLKEVTLPADYKNAESIMGLFGGGTLKELMQKGCKFNFIENGKVETLLPNDMYYLVYEEKRQGLIDKIEACEEEKRKIDNKINDYERELHWVSQLKFSLPAPKQKEKDRTL